MSETDADKMGTLPFSPEGEKGSVPIFSAIQLGAQRYFDDCRGRVDGFVAQHFCYPGAWRTNRIAIGWDLLRAPINLFWAPFYLLTQAMAWMLQRAGLTATAQRLYKTPSGLTTDVQRHLAHLCQDELLQRPQQGGKTDLLLEYIVGELDESIHIDELPAQLQGQLQQLLDDALEQYALSRTATAEIGNSLSTTLTGFFAFQKFTPGGIAIGLLLASTVARELATRDFLFGPTLGDLYYGWFPPAPTLAMSIATTAGVLLVLSSIAALSGILTDPLQSALGIHQRRLHKMLDHLEQSFATRSSRRFRTGEQLLARLLDLVDAARTPWL